MHQSGTWLAGAGLGGALSARNQKFDDLRDPLVALLGKGFGAHSGSPKPLGYC